MMIRIGFPLALRLLGCMAIAPTLLAHHGNAAYDAGKSVTVTGTVVEWLWGNPHCLLSFDVNDAKGNIVHWKGETSNPTDIMAHGWSKRMFKVGDEVTVTMILGRNGEPISRISTVIVNGKTFGGGSPGRAPPP